MAKRETKTRTARGEALFDVILATAAAFFRIREAGKRMGAVTPWGGGLWGMLRTLKLEGPCTVPQIARSRPVARQRIQKLANELAESGLIEFIDNPAHRRSKLLRLTPDGEAAYEEIRKNMADMAEQLAIGMKEAELRTTAAVLRTLRRKLEAGPNEP